MNVLRILNDILGLLALPLLLWFSAIGVLFPGRIQSMAIAIFNRQTIAKFGFVRKLIHSKFYLWNVRLTGVAVFCVCLIAVWLVAMGFAHNQ